MATIVELWRKFSGVALRVVVEFLVLAALGVLWAWFRVSDHATWSVGDGVEDGFKAFFFAGYFYNYLMRAVKVFDDRVKHGDLVAKQEVFLKQLTDTTNQLVGHASGGSSVGWLMMTDIRNGALSNITAHVEGSYPLLDARATVLDIDVDHAAALEEVQRTGDVRHFFKNHITFSFGTLQPGLAMLQTQTVPCGSPKELLRYRIDWTARNGIWTQYVQLKRRDHRWDFSTAVQRNESWVFENPPRDQLAKGDDGKPEVFWIDYPVKNSS
jgi:hypothetical protein